METRGRNQNIAKILEAQKYKNDGFTTSQISQLMGITKEMVRYFLKQTIKIKNTENKKNSLTKCFFSQPIEIQKEIAEKIGYVLPDTKEFDVVGYYKQASKKFHQADIVEEVKIKEIESELISKVRKFLNGEIKPNEIDDLFSYDEKNKLSKNNMFMKKSNEIFFGEKCLYTQEDVINNLKAEGL